MVDDLEEVRYAKVKGGRFVKPFQISMQQQQKKEI